MFSDNPRRWWELYRGKEYLREGHSYPGALAGCQWNTLSVLHLGFKSATGIWSSPWGNGALLSKSQSYFFSCRCQVNPWQWESERFVYEEDDLSLQLWAQRGKLKKWRCLYCDEIPEEGRLGKKREEHRKVRSWYFRILVKKLQGIVRRLLQGHTYLETSASSASPVLISLK